MPAQTITHAGADDTAPQLLPRSQRPPVALVLDDNEFDRLRLSRMLTRVMPEMEIRQARDVTDFVERLGEGPIDLVFIDYLLPGQDGLAALGKLRAHPDQTEAAPIMLVGHGDHRVARLALRGGCADYVEKSDLTTETLTRLLVETLGERTTGVEDDNRVARRQGARATVIRLVAALGLEIRTDVDQIRTAIAGLSQIEPPSEAEIAELSAICDDLAALVGDLHSYTARETGPVPALPPRP